MRQSGLGVAPWLLLTSLASNALAAKRPFNIHDDILAYPQYQVIYPQDYVLDERAQDLLEKQGSSPNDIASLKENADNAGDGETPGKDSLNYAYEEMILDDRRLLCQIPQVSQDELNATGVNPASESDEQKELARATDRGLELLRELEGKCMYYFSGWWSYSFCYRKQVKQFHALPPGRGVSTYPPTEDPTTHSFILGQFPGHKQSNSKTKEKEQAPKNEVAELHTKGGSRYLVQHLRGGTKCDLTGRERRIEVQFHCHPQSTDQIGWIKELTTCTYLMVIYTPRLCDDAAFLPPSQDEVHNIECREILLPEDVPEWEAMQKWFQAHELAEAAAEHPEVQVVGGIEVGGRKLVGMEGKTIEKGRVVSAGEEHVEVIAKRENGEVQRVSKQTLKKFDLDAEKVEDMRKQMEEYAGDSDWTLEVVASNGVFKFQGIVADDEETEEDTDAASEKDAPTHPKTKKSDSGSGDDPSSNDSPSANEEPQDTAGSEETFKDEL